MAMNTPFDNDACKSASTGEDCAVSGSANKPDRSVRLSQPACAARLSHVGLNFEGGIQALEDVSLEVAQGEYICVLGANGSGKSTLALVLAGLLAPDSGSVELLGEAVFNSEDAQPTKFDAYARIRGKLACVFQSPEDQIVTSIVEEDVAFGPENLGLSGDEIETRVCRELVRVAMQEYAEADPTKLSGGQQQRVALAGALALEPQLLVLDEPGSLLDVRGRNAIMRLLPRLHAQGMTLVHVTHFMEEALPADRVIVLDKGRVALTGTPSEVFAQHKLLYSLGLELPFSLQLAHALSEVDGKQPHTAPTAEQEGANASWKGAALMPEQDCATENWQGAARASERDVTPATAQSSAGTCDVSASQLTFSYREVGAGSALDDVSFEIARGARVALIGQTGSGKTTLARLIAALDVPDSGSLEVLGRDVSQARERRQLHGKVGYVMQHPERQLFAETVFQDVAFGPKNLGLKGEELTKRCQDALSMVGLSGLEDASPFELSGGQQRLCAIAGVLAMDPELLVMDEPSAGLDPKGREELERILLQLNARGITLIIITHSMDSAARADTIIALDNSCIWSIATPELLFSEKNKEALSKRGLGLPSAYTWARIITEKTGIDCGSPLHREDLLETLYQQPRDVQMHIEQLLREQVMLPWRSN